MKLLLFVLAGAIINVAVAWGLPAISGGKATWSDDGPPNVDDIEWWQANAPVGREVHDVPARVIYNKGLAFRTVYMIELRRTERSQPNGHTFERKMLGWPMLSLQSSIWDDPTQRATLRGVFFLSNLWPIEPIWPGFAINTVFYAAVLWGLFAVPGRVRRWRRIKRGQCASCGYSLRENTSDKCPECGHGEEENAASTRAL